MPKELGKGFRVSEGGVEKVRKAEQENGGWKMKERLPPRPKQALQMAFPSTRWGQGISPPLPNFSICVCPKQDPFWKS